MRKVGIIGLGHVGVTVAYTLITKGIVDELVCIDTDEKKAKAEFYDFSDIEFVFISNWETAISIPFFFLENEENKSIFFNTRVFCTEPSLIFAKFYLFFISN